MRKPQQKRALQTRAKILSALEELLSDAEFENVSIADIAHHAGVAVGSVYSHFEDKTALLPALIERRYDRIEARIATLKSDGSVEGIKLATEPAQLPELKKGVETIIRAAYAQVMKESGVMRAMMAYRRLHPEVDIPRATSIADEAFERIHHVLKQYKDEIGRDDLRSAAVMINHFVNVIFLEKVAFRTPTIPPHLNPDDEEKILAYCDMVYGYLITKN